MSAALRASEHRSPQSGDLPSHTHAFVKVDKIALRYLFVCFLCVSCAGFRAQKKPPLRVAFLLSFQTRMFGCGGLQPKKTAACQRVHREARRMTQSIDKRSFFQHSRSSQPFPTIRCQPASPRFEGPRRAGIPEGPDHHYPPLSVDGVRLCPAEGSPSPPPRVWSPFGSMGPFPPLLNPEQLLGTLDPA